jgi:catechol 2,3-dioxygenase-like lactoylglutathione lyase family enzyme
MSTTPKSLADTTTFKPVKPLDLLHHTTIAVRDVAEAVKWYSEHFHCTVAYQDATWAMLNFANVSLALVLPEHHPPHIAFSHPQAEKFGPLKVHADGTRSVYISDPSGNPVEVLARD